MTRMRDPSGMVDAGLERSSGVGERGWSGREGRERRLRACLRIKTEDARVVPRS